jgi:prepilin-type processing-associated H-X9-DG protein
MSSRSSHPGGLNVAFCDGSVRFIRDTLSHSPQLKGFLERLATEPVFRALFFSDPAGTALATGIKLKEGAAEKIRSPKIDPNAPLSVLIGLLLPAVRIPDGTSNTILFAESYSPSSTPSPAQWGFLLLPYIEQGAVDPGRFAVGG